MGFLAFINELKPDTKICIERLIKAKLDCKVISGDNPLTSIQCARECSILDQNKNTYVIDLEETIDHITDKVG